MLRLDKIGAVIRGVPLLPPLERGEEESDASFTRRKATHEMLAGVTVDVSLVDRPTALVWGDDASRMVMRVYGDAPVTRDQHAEFRAQMRAVIALGCARIYGVEIGGVDLSTLSGEALALAVDGCSLSSLLPDLSACVRRHQSLSAQEKKLSESSPSSGAVTS